VDKRAEKQTAQAEIEKLNQHAYELARKQADARFPLPAEMPWEAAFKAAVTSLILIATFNVLDEGLSRNGATLATIALAAIIAFADCRMRWRRNAQEALEAYRFYKDDPRAGGKIASSIAHASVPNSGD
jgi:hypothetical protein